MTSHDILIWSRRMLVMTRKEFLQLLRDGVLLIFIAYAFTADIYLAASGVSLQLNQAATRVLDQDRSGASRELLGRFQAPYFRIDGALASSREGQQLLDEGRAMLTLDIPPQFEHDLQRGQPTAIQMQIDATNSVLGFLASSYAAQIVGGFGLEAGLHQAGLSGGRLTDLPVIENRSRVWYNPNQNDAWFMGITELLTVITVFAVLLPAAAMVREKERGTVEQLLVSPLSPFQIMFPKVISMTVVILLGSGLSLFAVLMPAFDLPARGSLVAFFGLTALYVFTTAGLGLFAATLARNLAQVGMLTILILAPMLFLSGAWTPPEAMPVWLRDMMYVSPLHYYIDIAFGLLLKGQSLRALLPTIGGMLLLGAVVFGFGLYRFRRQFG
ncbi:ABC-2 type transport system permease protein [Chitinivorax tropicus]|uniref:ABC-2 type transport system permease protein n=1 Tax=Chitinivorax tropicus TaxID=714531 RepID=A0A840MJN5_9PROT|nr:ABC transporter permease [Chitinivorax tropicus]MBB5016776.1 ABC-2 type transport system permease protein [Chitinivorax tropicus]